VFNIDAFVKSRKGPLFVIPACLCGARRQAKAGIQYFQRVTKTWTPFFNGVTTF
jgi:hypothetical protein